MKGFKDSKGKFHPITDYKGVRKSRDQSSKSKGVKVERKAREGEEQSYWGQNGKYQKEADVLQKLVPAEGASPDLSVDLFRRASNLYYEIFNNGGGNLEGEGQDIEVKRFESEGFDLPIVNLLIEQLNEYDDQGEFVGDRDKYFEGAQDEMDRLMDQVIEQIMEIRKSEKNIMEARKHE